MNPKEMQLMLEIADRLDKLEAEITKRDARLSAVEARIRKYETFFFKDPWDEPSE
jgi:hypothetical protein